MIINWYGQNCFKIVASKSKNGNITIITDLFNKEIGLRAPKNDADILIMSKSGVINKEDLGNAFLVECPGEYDVKDTYIYGFKSLDNESGSFYTLEIEDIRICHLGFMGMKGLSAEQVEEIGDVDILMIPVGDVDALDAKTAIKIMSDIEPKITIPMNYKVPGIKTKLDDLSVFLKALGIKSLPAIPKLSIKKKDLPTDEAKIIVLGN
jgi:L-ascorbate metabolism protein UlaG (beta-lactamase superfamily)